MQRLRIHSLQLLLTWTWLVGGLGLGGEGGGAGGSTELLKRTPARLGKLAVTYMEHGCKQRMIR